MHAQIVMAQRTSSHEVLPGDYRPTDDRPVRAPDRLVLAYADASAAREARRRLRRVDAMGAHPVDARSGVDIGADDVPDAINAADHAAGLPVLGSGR